MSVPNPCAAGNSDNSASRIAPEPVPRSAMRSGRSRLPPARNSSSASSTTVSVSGRGTSVADESCKGSPQNSFSPRMRATGSPARRRRAKASRRADSSRVSWRCAADIKPVRSRPSAWPVRIRASSSADSMAAVLRLVASARRAASTVWPAKSVMLYPPLEIPPRVVPANAGTHNHRSGLLIRAVSNLHAPTLRGRGVWVPAFAGTTAGWLSRRRTLGCKLGGLVLGGQRVDQFTQRFA